MKNNNRNKIILVTIPFGLHLLYALPSFAGEDTRKGVAQTQELLKDPKFRAQNAKESKPAAELDQHIKQLSGNPKNEQEIYELAADVMGNMKDLTPEQMAKVVEQGSKNPEAFAESFTPAQKSKLHDIAERVPAAKAK